MKLNLVWGEGQNYNDLVWVSLFKGISTSYGLFNTEIVSISFIFLILTTYSMFVYFYIIISLKDLFGLLMGEA